MELLPEENQGGVMEVIWGAGHGEEGVANFFLGGSEAEEGPGEED